MANNVLLMQLSQLVYVVCSQEMFSLFLFFFLLVLHQTKLLIFPRPCYEFRTLWSQDETQTSHHGPSCFHNNKLYSRKCSRNGCDLKNPQLLQGKSCIDIDEKCFITARTKEISNQTSKKTTCNPDGILPGSLFCN